MTVSPTQTNLDQSASYEKTIRILYVDVDLHFINPTAALMPLLAAGIGDVTFYGPGYTSDAILSRGIRDFIDRSGPFDIAVLGPNVPILSTSHSSLQKSLAFIANFTALGIANDTTYAFFVDVLNQLDQIPVKHRFASLLTFDWYSATQAQIERLNYYNLKLISPNEHFIRRIADLPAWATREKHFQRNVHLLTDAWCDFVRSCPNRVITALHFVSESEFSFRGLAVRRREVSIPGIDYIPRREAVGALRKSGIPVAGKSIYNIYRTLNRLGIPVYANFISLKNFNLFYFRNLLDSKYVYTAAEAFGMPIRKFFEIPAAGAVLLSSQCEGFDRIGFRHRVNCVQAAPADLPEAIRELERDPEEAQRIAFAGRRLVLEQHSLSARSRQIKTCIEAVLDGTYAGAEWFDGSFWIRTNDGNTKSVERNDSSDQKSFRRASRPNVARVQ